MRNKNTKKKKNIISNCGSFIEYGNSLEDIWVEIEIKKYSVYVIVRTGRK